MELVKNKVVKKSQPLRHVLEIHSVIFCIEKNFCSNFTHYFHFNKSTYKVSTGSPLWTNAIGYGISIAKSAVKCDATW